MSVREIDVSRSLLPVKVSDNLQSVFAKARKEGTPVLAIVTGTKPDFYKQAPLVIEAAKENLPVFVINTGQHFDEVLGFGIEEFNLQQFVGCNLQIRGDLMEKASELIIKFGSFGRYCRKNFGTESLLPIVHGDTLVAGIAPLAWVFGMGQKVGQNEAGLRSMSPEAIKRLKACREPTKAEIRRFISSQFDGRWFLAREEPFPEQIDTWICSAGTQFFFAPTKLNRDNLVREGYPENFVHVVGNSVVDAIHQKRKEKSRQSIFDLYPQLEKGQWIRMDIHRRENLTHRRFTSIIGGLVQLIKNTDKKVVLVMLNATVSALKQYNLESKLKGLTEEHPDKFIMTPLWKEYANVIEFLDSGRCWAEMTDSGSMQEELLYFPKVTSLTVRLNTDRPETIFDAKSNILVPPLSPNWIASIVNEAYDKEEGLGMRLRRKKQMYGRPGQVSRSIIKIIKKEFENGDANFYPWLHQRLGLWKEGQGLDYM
ncbi:putative UDP-N-acetylglucosamine 2-epimerase [Candidatus Nitrososphaera gargensis Ga9.2]|uniref:Putative UDP-N-acetylglucosamine 2-epimerase n=1 Tax=Nitrososphaera gargensis (strain Ga9.2) TaxID=1237085 RepID=K0IHQ2_NITGG|nr:UDP-N-acetylglucosamine 2-epimerase [Candidatus Nitrososphaera gargensis]AFU58473.1 putative UDP-N-acetylglucosamine 2-epimerase [Candidatus Nitrososphaera gargensis Ga9.2]